MLNRVPCVLYWTFLMTPLNAILVLTLPSQPTLYAAQKQYQSATMVEVQEKTNTRVINHVVDTPITRNEPYYKVSVQLKDMVYLGRYLPRHRQDSQPDEWVATAMVGPSRGMSSVYQATELHRGRFCDRKTHGSKTRGEEFGACASRQIT